MPPKTRTAVQYRKKDHLSWDNWAVLDRDDPKQEAFNLYYRREDIEEIRVVDQIEVADRWVDRSVVMHLKRRS